MRPAKAKASAWTEEEDALLLKYQGIYGNQWSKISKHIPNRNGQQVAQRWRHKVNPGILKEKWTREEDRTLTEMVQELGVGKWASVARHLPGRTDQQCMGRWRRHLDPTIRKDPWTQEEDALLEELFTELGSSWSLIAKDITNRTPQQCRGRWCFLKNNRDKGSAKGRWEQVAASAATPEAALTNLSVRNGRAATSVEAAESARHGRVELQGCPSAVIRLEATTELPAMPASTTEPTLAGEPILKPLTAEQLRLLTSATAAIWAAAGTSGLPGSWRWIRRRRVFQVPLPEDTPTAAPGSNLLTKDGAEAGPAGTHMGRMLLGTRVLSFPRRVRSMHGRPRAGLMTAAHSARDNKPAEMRGCGDAAQDAKDCNGSAHDCKGVGSGGLASGATRWPHGGDGGTGANNKATTCERPTASTKSRDGLDHDRDCSHGRPAGRTEAAPGDVLKLPPRTRSGRRYTPVTTTMAVATAQGRHSEVASRSRRSPAPQAEADILNAGASCANGHPGDATVPVTIIGTSDAPLGSSGDAGAHIAAASRSFEAFNGQAAAAASAYHLFTAHGAASPQQQQTTRIGNVNASLELSDGLFDGVGASPALDEGLDWQNGIGSPPTSSFLALMEAGLLQTPPGARGPSSGPHLLCAPIPPDLPKVSPGDSSKWSDVIPMSWPELQECHDVLDGIGCVPVTSAHGTPDNSRPLASRSVPGSGLDGITPRRDMYVRPDRPGDGAASGRILSPGFDEPADENEGQGDTRSCRPSPHTKIPCPMHADRDANRGSAREPAVMQSARCAGGAPATPDRPQQQQRISAKASTPRSVSAGTLLDLCSPTKKMRASLGRVQDESQAATPGSRAHLVLSAAHASSGPAAHTSPAATLAKAAPTRGLPSMPALGGVQPSLPPMIDAASHHPRSAMLPPFALPSQRGGPQLLSPKRACAPGPPPAAHEHAAPVAYAGSTQLCPPLQQLQLPSAVLGASSANTIGVSHLPAAGSFGRQGLPHIGVVGLAPNGAALSLPRLALPNAPSGSIRALLMIASRNSYQASKENNVIRS